MLKGKKLPETNVPPILKATANLVLADLGNYQIKAGQIINLYALFPQGMVRKSKAVKYALDHGVLVPDMPVQTPKPAPSTKALASASKAIDQTL
jgi:hypothetical protein